MASGQGTGAVAVLGYAYYLYIIIIGVFTYALSAVVFPSLSKMHANQDYEEFIKLINKALKAVVFVVIPIIVGLLILNVPLIRVLLQRGKFDVNSTMITSTVLFFYSFGMIGFAIQEIINKGFYALHDTKTPMIISVFGMSLNVFLSIMLVKAIGIGGLALASSIASTFITNCTTIKIKTVIPQIIEKQTLELTFKVIISSIVMGILYF